MKPLRIFRRYRRGVLVLLYHRVSELRRDPWSLCVSPAQFEQQLRVLREEAHPIRLSELGANLGQRLFPRPPVAVTFDDGYADNLHQAAPPLRHFNIPATLFAVSGAVRGGREFWWDELEKIVFEADGAAATRELRLMGRTFTWRPDNGVAGRDDWQAWTEQTPTQAHGIYRELYGVLSLLPPDDQKTLIDDLIHQAGVATAPRATHRPLSCAELRELAHSSMIDIGVHTVSHPVLSRLPVAQQTQEVLQAKSELEAITGKPMRQFSYPYGKREHWDSHTIDIVRRAGFDYACTNEPGIAGASVDRFQVPRVVAPALDGPPFARWMKHCLATLD